MKTSKYSIGDWFYDTDVHRGNPNPKHSKYFWKITGVHTFDGGVFYDVAFMSDTNNSLEFRHWGDLGGVSEGDLRPVTGAIDMIRCQLSDAQTEYRKAKAELGRCQVNIDALSRTKKILEKEK
jgi:hypothetical protein